MNELKVGILTLLAVGSVFIVMFKITSNKTTFGEFVEYRTIINDATGIYENSSIKVAGIIAGRIKSIELSGSQALIKFDILQKIKITRSSHFRIKSVGFLGDKYIDIYLGDQQGPRLKQFSMVTNQAAGGLDQIGRDASEILKDVKVIAKTIKNALQTDEKKNALKEIMKEVHAFSVNINHISQTVKSALGENGESINSIIDSLETVGKQLAYETDKEAEFSFMNSLDKLNPILDKLDGAASDLKIMMADMKAGKGTVGKLLREEEVIDQVNETLSGVNKIVGKVNNYQSDIAIFSGVNNNQGAKSSVELDLMPNPQKFFRFGIISGDTTVMQRKSSVTTSTDGSKPVTVDKVEENDTEYRFNLQIGRDIGRYTFRAGLIETKGGLGFDYSIPEYGLKASAEVFDYRSDIGVNVKLGTELRLWNVLHAKIIGEDLSNDSKNHIFTYSLGLKFSDEDLASLIGLAI